MHAAILINNIALALSEMSNYKEALERYFEALRLHEEARNEQGKALTLSNIGIVYFNLQNYDRAIEFYEQSLQIRFRLDDAFGIASAFANIGNALGMKKEFEQAQQYFDDALIIFREKQDLNNEAMVYSLKGQHLISAGDETQGKSYLQKALEIHLQTGNVHHQGVIYYDLAMLHLNKKEYRQAFEKLTAANSIFRGSGNVDMLSKSHAALADYYDRTGDYEKALEQFKIFHHINDSIFAFQADERIAAAELRYETEKKEAEISRLSSDAATQKLSAEKHRQSRNIFLFISLVVLLLALMLYVRYRLKNRLARILKQTNKELSEKETLIRQQKEKIESQYKKLQQLDSAKTRFFANISHEFRTPLTLIQGPLSELLNDKDKAGFNENTLFKLRLAERNTRQLKNLTDQLLDLSKLKTGKLKLRSSEQDIAAYLGRVANTFQSAIPPTKSITIDFQSPQDAVWIYFDAEKLDQIINNLVSNAIKAIDNSGEIAIRLEAPEQAGDTDECRFVKIEVSDNGRGISEKDLPLIFNRFFRADDSGLQEEGSGIGLEITRELVELHGGSIEVASQPGVGSVFTVYLPLGTDHLEADEMIAELIPVHSLEVKSKAENTFREETLVAGQSSLFHVMIVEDHADMRDYVAEHLKDRYKLSLAKNGEEALAKISKDLPDLIVSDLMMPGMDGLALLRHLRKQKNTADIPFILLTARAGDEDRFAGFELKADAYITKPFRPEELLLRIANLLETRQAIKEKYSRKIIAIDLNREGLTTADQQFLEKAKQAVIRNMGDASFGIQQLAGKVFLGERQFRRKVHVLSGLTPVDFIRQIRLQQAKILIEHKVYDTISEVSAAVGFNNPAYFSRLYKKMFGISPVEKESG